MANEEPFQHAKAILWMQFCWRSRIIVGSVICTSADTQLCLLSFQGNHCMNCIHICVRARLCPWQHSRSVTSWLRRV